MKYLTICLFALFLVACDGGTTVGVSTDTDATGSTGGDGITGENGNSGSDNSGSDNGDSDNGDSDNGDSDNGDSGVTEPGDAVAGKALFESAELGCTSCHGADAQSITPIDISAETFDESGVDYTMEAFIENFMPFFNATACDAECAVDIAAYLRTLRDESSEPTTTPEEEQEAETVELFSVVSRLTNDEYYAALSDLLALDDDQQALLKENVPLAAEIEESGLVSTVGVQQLNQLTFNTFLTAATEASALRLDDGGTDALTLENFKDRIMCGDTSLSLNDCVRERGIYFLERGFRGQANDADISALDSLLEAFDDQTMELDNLARLKLRYQTVLQFVALSPKFTTIYETGIADEEIGSERPLTEMEIANRLAFFIAGTRPDAPLEAAANDGLLSTPEERKNQALRLITDEKSSAIAEKIVARWLGFNPELTDEASVTETENFIRSWIQERRPFSDLYTSTVAVNTAAVNGQGTTVTYEPFGALGLQGVVQSHTNPPVSSFINRGEFIVADLLCGNLPADIPDVAIEGEVVNPLQIFQEHTKQPCATCHRMFDNYGAAMQRFDGENSLYNPGDDWLGTSFELFPIGDVSGTVSDVADLGSIIGVSRQAHSCFANLWYRHSIRRDLAESDTSEDKAVINEIVDEWMAGDSSVMSLIELIASHETFSKLFR